MSSEQSIKMKIEELTSELKIEAHEEDFTLILEKELKKAGRTHSFYGSTGNLVKSLQLA
jgi:hypothetical protein